MDGKTSLSTQEVAQILNISKNTVYELIKRGELPSYRVGRKVRVDFQDVEYYKDKSRTNSIVASPTNFKGFNSIHQESINNTAPTNVDIITKNTNDFIISGQELLLDILTQHLAHHSNGIKSLRSYSGSYNSLIELYKGNVSIVSCNLWDSDTNSYNIPYIRRLLPGVPCIIIRLVCRMEGFYVAKGNPKKISTWTDLTRPDIKMVNRELGSGVRILTDEYFRKLNILHTSINGYNTEMFSHFAVASAVARGEADVAIGNEKAALQVKNVDFIPLQKEKCDLVIKKEDINKPAFKAIFEILASKEFKMEIEGIDNYDTNETGKIIGEV